MLVLGLKTPVEALTVIPVAEYAPPVYTPVPVNVGLALVMSLQNGELA